MLTKTVYINSRLNLSLIAHRFDFVLLFNNGNKNTNGNIKVLITMAVLMAKVTKSVVMVRKLLRN